MRRNFKKVLAVMMAATFAMSSAVCAFAEDGEGVATPNTVGSSSTGEVKFEGIVKTDIFHVELPVVTAGTFDMILDPSGLIGETAGAKYGDGVQFEANKTVYFEHPGATAGQDNYSSMSDEVVIKNKGTAEIDITVKATLKNYTGITLFNTNTFTGTAPGLYLAISSQSADDTQASATGITADKGVITVTDKLEAPANAYKYIWDDTAEEYKYVLITDENKATGETPVTAFPEFTFSMTGECYVNDGSADIDWSSCKDVAPAIEVEWSIVVPDGYVNNNGGATSGSTEAAPSLADDSNDYTMTDGEELVVTIDLGAGDLAADDVAKITYISSGATKELATTYYSTEVNSDGDLEITFTSTLIDANISKGGRDYTIVMNDDEATEIAISMVVSN